MLCPLTNSSAFAQGHSPFSHRFLVFILLSCNRLVHSHSLNQFYSNFHLINFPSTILQPFSAFLGLFLFYSILSNCIQLFDCFSLRQIYLLCYLFPCLVTYPFIRSFFFPLFHLITFLFYFINLCLYSVFTFSSTFFYFNLVFF